MCYEYWIPAGGFRGAGGVPSLKFIFPSCFIVTEIILIL